MESRYKILEHIDSGGMAEVFKGRAQAIHGIEKTVAIKRILPHLARNRKFVAMFLDEARLSIYLNHANIVQVFDIARAEGNYFIVMEFVEGANLRTLLDRARDLRQPFPVEKAVLIASCICRGLSYAHGRSDHNGIPLHIVHRDVSPPNILLSHEGEVKIVDFGLAKAASQLEDSDPDILKGKLGYMSPEQAWGKAIDHRADLFAAGILLYEMLTATRLFRGESDLETLEMVRAAQIPSARECNPRVPQDLDRLLMRALSKDPAQRYQTARQLEDDLWEFLFRNQRKVTPHALGAWVREQSKRRPKRPDSITTTIDQMIQEEILRVVSIETYDLPEDSPPPVNQDGSRPLRLDLEGSQPIRLDLEGSQPVMLEGRQPIRLDEGKAAGAPGADFTGITDLLEPDPDQAAGARDAKARPAPPEEPAPPDSPAKPRGQAGWWVLAILILAGIGSGIYFLLRAADEPPPRSPTPARRTR